MSSMAPQRRAWNFTELHETNIMASCETCGNVYDKAFHVILGGVTHAYDCFECAIHALAPLCAHCGCRIIGHGVEVGVIMFCCAHCAKAQGADGIRDRIGAAHP